MLTLRKTNAADAEFWQRLGKTLPRSGEAFVIEDGGKQVGVLHYTLLWEELPFLNLLLLCGDMQGKGYGKARSRHGKPCSAPRGTKQRCFQHARTKKCEPFSGGTAIPNAVR